MIRNLTNNKKHTLNLSKESDILIIRNSKLKFKDYFLIPSCCFIFVDYVISGFKDLIFTLIIIPIIFFYGIKTFKRIKDRNPKIIIDNYGVKICKSNIFANWSEIKHIYIKEKTQGIGRGSQVIDYLHIIKANSGEIITNMSDFSYNKKELVDIINKLSGKN